MLKEVYFYGAFVTPRPENFKLVKEKSEPVRSLKTTFIIKKAPAIITSPTIAATIWFLAASTPALSPPDITHFIPP